MTDVASTGSARVRVVVRGRVQGVGYRATTAYEAGRLRLGGWVRNRADGTVEIEAQGERADLESFLTFLRKGPRGAHVDGVDCEWLAPDSAPSTSFTVRRTT